MIYSRNIIFIFFLLTFLDSMMSVYGISTCERNILTDFEYVIVEYFPKNVRHDMPRRAFLRKTINDLKNDDAKRYFQHLHHFLNYKKSMLLPREFCDVRSKFKQSREKEYKKCVDLLLSTFLDSYNKTDVIKSTFWYFTEGMFSNVDAQDYRYRYYYHLCGQMIYAQNADQRFPFTIREFCASLYPDKNIDLMSRDHFEFTKEEAQQYCTIKIFNDFDLNDVRKQTKARIYMPRTAFLTLVEDDLESPDAKDYFFHIYGVIKAKDGTENPRQYCNTIAKDFNEQVCVGYLLSMYMDSDATTVLKDAFLNFKESHVSGLEENDYIYRYFYYLSGNYEFYKSEIFKSTPLTPWEFCQFDRTVALDPRIIME